MGPPRALPVTASGELSRSFPFEIWASLLQEANGAEQQARGKAEAQLKTLQENARLDFERIGVLSEENAELKVMIFPHVF